jgi:hypothetical protein
MRIQQKKKLIKKQCFFCEEKDLKLLDCHRIVPGSKYTLWGTLCLCANCHRKIHSGIIQILGKYSSTIGPVIEYVENGVAKIRKE